MIYWIEAAIEGQLIVGTSFCFRVGAIMFLATADDEGLLTKLAAGERVDAQTFATRVELSDSRTPTRLVIGGDRVVSKRLVSALQDFESHVSFMTGQALNRVRWDASTEIWQPESFEEERLVQVNNVALRKEENNRLGRVAPDVLAGMAARAQALNQLTVLKALLREGSNEFQERRYIQAFYDFYFVIEGRYANGKSSEVEVLKSYRGSGELMGIARKTFELYRGLIVPSDRLARLLAAERCSIDAEGLLRLTVRLRGRLHHFNPRSGRPQPTPFEQDAFREIALIMRTMAMWAIGQGELELKAKEATRGV